MAIFFLTLGGIAVLMLIMAVGVIFKRKPLRGSCGGAEIWDCDGDDLTCGACPNREKKRSAAQVANSDEGPAERLRRLTSEG